jgi:hypothetical protein
MPGVTLGRASAGIRSLCFFPNQAGCSHFDLQRRLTPIPRRSQRLNIFFVFNRSGRRFHTGVRILRCVACSGPRNCLFMCSSITPRVSGMNRSAATNCNAIMPANTTNGAGLECAAMMGKVPEISAFKIQCVALPTA